MSTIPKATENSLLVEGAGLYQVETTPTKNGKPIYSLSPSTEKSNHLSGSSPLCSSQPSH